MINSVQTKIGEIETERLLLRPFALNDANEVFREWASHKNVTEYLTWNAHGSISETKAFLLDMISNYERDGIYCWGILNKDEDLLIGSISAKITDERSKIAELGYVVGERFWNMGYGSEALRAVCDYMLYDANMNRLEGFCSVKNPASGRVMQKAGLVKEGHMRQKYITGKGEYQDSDFYGLVKKDFEAQFWPGITEFLDLGKFNLFAHGLYLVCRELYPGNPKKNHVPGYTFDIIEKNSRDIFGEISLRLGFTDGLYYGGHIGFSVFEQYRNLGVATTACGIVLELAKAHKFQKIIITNNHANKASRRVCEKLGAKMVRIARIPEWHDLYIRGQRLECIYELKI